MKKRKVVLPIMAFMLAAGLAACQGEPAKSVANSQPAASSATPTPSSSQMQKIVVTADKNSLEVEETTHVHSDITCQVGRLR